ncbi:unnamed protein product [Periconia digitata]|uniref:FAD-binding PCMH-type domain-containing protein n=1 Tax=Periconia digitata TaxID=1303443 RepID=A0A9W4U7Q5_9PLEO|nr:unnamed protein product [Periconia digitata]
MLDTPPLYFQVQVSTTIKIDNQQLKSTVFNIGHFSVIMMAFTKHQIGYLFFAAITIRPSHSEATPDQWKALNASVDGRLHVGVPVAEPCFNQYNTTIGNDIVGSQSLDKEACAQVAEGYHKDTYLSSQFGGYINSNWATCQKTAQGCSLDWLDPSNTSFLSTQVCHQGSVPSFYIDVRNVSDIRAGLEFARTTGTPLSIKNTGHDFQGRSSAPGSLAIWTHNIRPELQLTDNFVPDGCAQPVEGKAITFGAGQQFGELYEFGQNNNLTIIGGVSPTVGTAGGWISGGGHSQISNTFGMGVDNVLQIRTVLPNGTVVTANECQNQDMWFALRGGGGGTFGVNYEMTSRALPAMTLRVASVSMNTSNPEAISKFLTILIENASRWAAEGWSGHVYGGASYSDVSGFNLANPRLSLEEAKLSMEPVFEELSASLGSEVTLTASVTNYESYYKFFKEILVGAGPTVGIAVAYGGRLVPASQFEGAENRTILRDALLAAKALVTYPTRNTTDANVVHYGQPFLLLAVTPYNYPVTSANDTSSIHPSWRDSIWNVVTNLPFSNQADVDEIQRAFQGAHDANKVLLSAMPGSGSYSNEADLYEIDHTTAFWGEKNYDRLLSIKKSIDPDNLLTCWHCIGYDPNDARYGCYPSLD